MEIKDIIKKFPRLRTLIMTNQTKQAINLMEEINHDLDVFDKELEE